MKDMFIEKPLVSVLMSTFKEPMEWIEESIGSIFNQSYSNIQLVVVIDDPSRIDIITYLENKKTEYNIKVVRNSKNIGLVQSLNKGLSFCDGTYIARMDADDISTIDRISSQFDYLSKNKLDLIGGYTQTFFEKKQNAINKTCFTTTSCIKTLKYSNCIAHPTWFGKKSVFELLKGYRNIEACEDIDFLIRAILSGVAIGNLPELVLFYRDNPNSISHEKKYRQIATAEFLCKRYRSGMQTSLEDYNSYINSADFLQDIDRYKTIYKTDACNNNAMGSLKCKFKKLLNKEYLRQKLINQIIKFYRIWDFNMLR